MKRIFLILSLLILCSSELLSQVNDDLYYSPSNSKSKLDLKSIPKGTYKIIINTGKNKSENFQLIGETLLSEDYQIDKANKDFFSITTVPKSHNKLNFSYVFNFIAKDTVIILTGTFKINASINLGSVTSEFSYDRIENKGQNGSPIKESFRTMIEFALKLSDIKYMKFYNE